MTDQNETGKCLYGLILTPFSDGRYMRCHSFSIGNDERSCVNGALLALMGAFQIEYSAAMRIALGVTTLKLLFSDIPRILELCIIVRFLLKLLFRITISIEMWKLGKLTVLIGVWYRLEGWQYLDIYCG